MERWPLLQSAMDSIAEQDHQAEQIVLVIDNNEDLLKRCRRTFPDAVVIPNVHGRGLAGARNSGTAAASGDVLVFLDDDAKGLDGWLGQMLAPYDDPTVAGVGGSIEPLWESGRPAWFPPEFDWVVGCTYAGLPSSGGEVRNMIGASMSFRADALSIAGPFREELGRVGNTPLGCEETELCIRLSATNPGARLMHEPSSRVLHLVPAQRARVRYFASRCYSEGLSKAQVVGLAGATAGLASEREYATRTLPRSAVRGVADVFRGDGAGAGRAVAIASGLVITAVGYVVGRVRGGWGFVGRWGGWSPVLWRKR